MAAATFSLAVITLVFFGFKDGCSNSRGDANLGYSSADSGCGDSGYTNSSAEELTAEAQPLLMPSRVDMSNWQNYGGVTL